MSRLLRLSLGAAVVLLGCSLNAAAHGGDQHQQVVAAPDADWPTRHMAGMLITANTTETRHTSTDRDRDIEN